MSEIIKKFKDFENDANTISQHQFNNSKYCMKFDTYFKQWNNSTDINISNNYKLGENVIVSGIEDGKEIEHFGKKGTIVLGFGKNPDDLKIEFKDGTKALVDKMYISKISLYDFNQEDFDAMKKI